MDKSVQITTIIIAGVLLITIIGFTTLGSFAPNSNTITGNGEASIEALPDLVTIYFNVQTEGDELQKVQDENSQISDNLITNLVKQGFERKDIQTQNYNIGPKYNWNNDGREQDGYQAIHSIRLEMLTENTNQIGDAIDAGIDAGASINYINFELSQELQNQYKAQAIELSAQDARIKAEALAKGLDKKLGKLVSVSSGNFGYNPWRIYSTEASMDSSGDEAKVATTNIAPSEQEIYASVTATFKIR